MESWLCKKMFFLELNTEGGIGKNIMVSVIYFKIFQQQKNLNRTK